MRRFLEIFRLEAVGLVRSRVLLLLLALSVAWMFACPHLLRGDGTLAGARSLAVHYSLGGVAALLAVSLLALATGSLAGERAAKRLQLTLVRPVRPWILALAKTAALSAFAALVLVVAASVECVRGDLGAPCRHVLRPVLPDVREEAAQMYEAFMADAETPEEVKRAKKEVVLRLLEQRAVDHYQTLATNELALWRFDTAARPCAARFRFTNPYDARDEVRGGVRFGACAGVVSNITQAIVEVPLAPSADAAPALPAVADGERRLAFFNGGRSALMLRPRRDVQLLVPADKFGRNLVRALLQLWATLTLLAAFGVFLGAGLARPVALFVAIVLLLVAEMSPSVLEQYPDRLEQDPLDAIGLRITRFVAEVTHPVSARTPLADLAEGTCVEPRETLRAVALDALLLPFLLAFLSGLVLPRKPEDA